ncbi:MAG: insulinase family protein [Spirochaetales bacterium]|nr:insulinase family protein [Spirochaetales bacterium]
MNAVHGFSILEESSHPEYRASGVWARHEASGCELFHLRNDDTENLFSFVFKTLPSDSTGVAHILEHTVLCGSRRFPVKDPFVMLIRGSLNTFVNAMTYPDKTAYPASSTVSQDLFNVMQVYGDAVFSPLLRREFFQQEGHRIGFTDDGRLDLTGIVYSEMKGNYANHDSLVGEWSYRSLMPDTPYGYDVGGDPSEIPNLTFDDFVNFHTTYYHPSNARVFVYGDIPTETYMEFLDQQFLSHFDSREVDFHVPVQPRWAEPREKTVTCQADEDGGGPTSITISWLLDKVTDPYLVLSFELLSEMLLGTSAAPLRKRLIESGLGDDLSAATGFESELHELIFSVGLRGTSIDRKDEIAALILDELGRLVREGFDPDIAEATFRKVEFRNREIRGGPNGLRMMSKSLRGWLHGEPPDATLRFQEPFSRLRQEGRPGSRYFETLIERNLLNNRHRSTVIVVPDPGQRERERQNVRARLLGIEEALTDADRERISAEQAALATLQQTPDSPQAAATIPFLKSTDLPVKIDTIPTDQLTVSDGVTVYTHDIFANGVVYVDLVFDISGVQRELLPFLPFYAGALGEVGLPGKSFDQVATEVALKTGGLHGYIDAALPVHESRRADRRFYLRVKALESTLAEALDLVREILSNATLDNEPRLLELWKERKSELSGAILPAGSGFASLRASRSLSDADRYEEEWQGINQLLFLNDSPSEPGRALTTINEGIVRRANLMVNITGGERGIAQALPLIDGLVGALPAGGWAGRVDAAESGPFPSPEALIVPSDVAYVAAAIPASRFGTEEHVHELILAHLLRTGYLWETIRMKGGAYGANASARGTDAVFGFSSYQDPRIVETIEAFSEGLLSYADETVGGRDLELAQIGVTGHQIRPLSPGQKGMIALRRTLYGVTDLMRQEKRNTILAASAGDIRRAAERLRDTMSQATIAVMANREAVEDAAKKHPGLAGNRITVPV